MGIWHLPIYIHIPFCVRKCNYCDFHSFAGNETQIDRYLDSLERECHELGELFGKVSAKTIYIGGGTPTLLNLRQWEKLTGIIGSTFDLSDTEEYTVEMNPGTADLSLLEFLLRQGIDRISLGVQSFDDRDLIKLGRIHTVEDVYQTVAMFHALQLDNWSLDLMYGLPGQTVQMWEKTLNQAIEMNPAHISTYNLKVEEHTPFYEQMQRGLLTLPDEDCVVDMYEIARNSLRNHGYRHYEISNYCREGRASKHNMAYWNHDDYLGVGSAAWSYISNTRYANPETITDYCNRYGTKAHVQTWEEFLQRKTSVTNCDLQCRIGDYVMLNLRKYEGISMDKFKKKFSVDFETYYAELLKQMLQWQLICRTDKGYRLTNRGVLLSNEVMEAFL